MIKQNKKILLILVPLVFSLSACNNNEIKYSNIYVDKIYLSKDQYSPGETARVYFKLINEDNVTISSAIVNREKFSLSEYVYDETQENKDSTSSGSQDEIASNIEADSTTDVSKLTFYYFDYEIPSGFYLKNIILSVTYISYLDSALNEINCPITNSKATLNVIENSDNPSETSADFETSISIKPMVDLAESNNTVSAEFWVKEKFGSEFFLKNIVLSINGTKTISKLINGNSSNGVLKFETSFNAFEDNIDYGSNEIKIVSFTYYLKDNLLSLCTSKATSGVSFSISLPTIQINKISISKDTEENYKLFKNGNNKYYALKGSSVIITADVDYDTSLPSGKANIKLTATFDNGTIISSKAGSVKAIGEKKIIDFKLTFGNTDEYVLSSLKISVDKGENTYSSKNFKGFNFSMNTCEHFVSTALEFKNACEDTENNNYILLNDISLGTVSVSNKNILKSNINLNGFTLNVNSNSSYLFHQIDEKAKIYNGYIKGVLSSTKFCEDNKGTISGITFNFNILITGTNSSEANVYYQGLIPVNHGKIENIHNLSSYSLTSPTSVSTDTEIDMLVRHNYGKIKGVISQAVIKNGSTYLTFVGTASTVYDGGSINGCLFYKSDASVSFAKNTYCKKINLFYFNKETNGTVNNLYYSETIVSSCRNSHAKYFENNSELERFKETHPNHPSYYNGYTPYYYEEDAMFSDISSKVVSDYVRLSQTTMTSDTFDDVLFVSCGLDKDLWVHNENDVPRLDVTSTMTEVE